MVQRSKRKEKKRKTVARVVNMPRGGFVPGVPRAFVARPTLEAAKRYTIKVLKDKAKESGFDIDGANKAWKKLRTPTMVDVGKTAAGIAIGVGNEIFKGSENSSAWVAHSGEKVRQLGSTGYSQKIYTTSWEHGRSNPRVMKTLARMHGKTRMTLRDTKYDSTWGVGSSGRDHLNISTGFNQKLVASPNMWHVLSEDMANAFTLNNYSSNSDKTQVNMGQTMNLWREMDIMNTGRFLRAKVKLSFFKMNDRDVAVSSFLTRYMANPTVLATNAQTEYHMPYIYQLTGVESEAVAGFTAAHIDPAVNVFTTSANAKIDLELAKSFTKTLAPGEIWRFKEKFHCGSGLDLDELKNQDARQPDHPLGYLAVMEVTGVPVLGCYAANSNENFIGTSPAWIQVTSKVGHETVINAKNSNAAYLLESAGGGVQPEHWHVRSFTRNLRITSDRKIFNVANSDITDDPTNTAAGKLFIPVLSDTQVRYVERAREGGTE